MSQQAMTRPDGANQMCKCPHHPSCPGVQGPDREAAHVIASHPCQGWSLLCNGIVLFDDTGELLPDGRVIPPHRASSHHHGVAA